MLRPCQSLGFMGGSNLNEPAHKLLGYMRLNAIKLNWGWFKRSGKRKNTCLRSPVILRTTYTEKEPAYMKQTHKLPFGRHLKFPPVTTTSLTSALPSSFGFPLPFGTSLPSLCVAAPLSPQPRRVHRAPSPEVWPATLIWPWGKTNGMPFWDR